MQLIQLTKDNFDAVVKAHDCLLVDFEAAWCGPCKAFKKVLMNVLPEYPEVVVASVDVDKQAELAQEFNVKSVPFIMILRKQVVVYAESGSLTPTGLRELLDQAQSLDDKTLRATGD